MRCLLTGATGFLGRRVLQLLLGDSRVETIHLISRQKRTHPDPRIKVHVGDLTTPGSSPDYFEEIDAVLHLAGLYQFNLPFSHCYQQNVLPVLNLLDQLRQLKTKRKPRILFASTYVVGSGSNEPIPEGPLARLPAITETYAYTKALAERALSDSGYPASIFRLGVLVGDQHRGEIDKIDGPYYLMRFLNRLSHSKVSQVMGCLPVPASKDGVIPLVPVDSAAQVICNALFSKPMNLKPQNYYGVFHSESMNPERLTEILFEHYLPNCRPVFMSRKVPEFLFNLQAKVTKIPKEIFDYSLNPVPLANPNFQEVFGLNSIPHFETYQDRFFQGFENCFLGHSLPQT